MERVRVVAVQIPGVNRRQTHPAKDEDERAVLLARDGAAQPLDLFGGRRGVSREVALEVAEDLFAVLLDLDLAQLVRRGVPPAGRRGHL